MVTNSDHGQDTGALAPRRIILVREDVRRIGPLVIDPPRRIVRRDDGRSVTLEPRTMQLLVALLEADGGTLSRDDLIQSCWEGRIVGDDSVSSVVYRLRRDMREVAEGLIEVETVTKVGFRLVRPPATDGSTPVDVPAEVPMVPAEDPPEVAAFRRRRWPAMLVCGLLLAALAATGWYWMRSRGAAVERPLAISPVAGVGVNPTEVAVFGDSLRSTINDIGIPLAARGGDLRLSTSMHRSGAGLEVTSQLDDLAKERTLWTQSRTVPADNDRRLAGEANRVANVVKCGMPAIAQGVAPTIVASTFRYCEADDRDVGLVRARELVAAAPDFPYAYLMLADAAAGVISWGGPETDNVRREGLAAADRFVAMRPDLSDGYVQRALLLPFDQPLAREQQLRQALDKPFLSCACAEAFLGDFLMQSGRLDEGFALYERDYDRNQNEPLALLRLIIGLDIVGQHGRAGTMVDRYEAQHGPRADLRFAHMLYVQPRPRALARPPYGDPAFETAATAAFGAMASGAPADRARASALLRAVAVTRKNEYPLAALLAELGDGDGALAVAEASRRSGTSFAGPGRYPGLTSALLWDPRLTNLWHAAGFPAYLNRTGFYGYWRASGSIPDTCRKDQPPPFCAAIRAAANRKAAM